jgi:hypothetical protein
VIASAFVATSCKLPPKHEYELAPGQEYDPSLETALLLPINETETLPEGLQKGEVATFRLVRQYLQAQGLNVETPEITRFRRVRNAALKNAQRDSMSVSPSKILREVGLADLISEIADKLAPKDDLVVVPDMVIRSGELNSKSLRWDGVRRVAPATERSKWSGTSSAASLHVAIFKADGTHLFSGYGGLDVLWIANIRARRMELIDDRLEDEANLREGVCVAFYPYFGDGESC